MLPHYTKTLFSVLLVLLFAAAVFSQEPAPTRPKEKKGRLHVSVASNDNNQPIVGADVMVRSTDGDFEDSTRTDSQGMANIANVPYANLIIQVLMRGYKNWGGQVDFKTDKPISIKLEPDAKPRPSPSPAPSTSPQ